MTDLEHQMARLYETTVIDADLPIDDIVAGALRQGRRRRRIRRVAAAAEWSCAGLLVATLVGGSAYLFWPREHAANPPLQSAATATATAPATKSVTPQTVARTLSALLASHGQVTNIRATTTTTTSSTGDSIGTVDLNTGHGPAAVSAVVGIGKPAAAGSGQFSSSTASDVTCSVRTLADGSVLITSQQTTAPADGAMQWSVNVGRPDGTSVGVYEWNSARPKGSATADATHPPLTMPELQTIATSDQW